MLVSLFRFVAILRLVAWSVQQDPEGTSANITCYDWDGNGYGNNTQCPGSNICCNTANLCNENRFCIEHNQTIVPTCAVYPWSDCSNICQYVTGTGYLPRVVQCIDGSYCCDDDASCCADDRGIVLNGLGAIVSTDPGLTSTSTPASTSSSSTLKITSASTVATISSSAPTSTSTQTASSPAISSQSSGGLTSGAKAGIGVGVAVIAVAAAVITLTWFFRRRSRQGQPIELKGSHEIGTSGSEAQSAWSPAAHRYQQPYSPPVEMPTKEPQSHELPAKSSQTYELPAYGTPK